MLRTHGAAAASSSEPCLSQHPMGDDPCADEVDVFGPGAAFIEETDVACYSVGPADTVLVGSAAHGDLQRTAASSTSLPVQHNGPTSAPPTPEPGAGSDTCSDSSWGESSEEAPEREDQRVVAKTQTDTLRSVHSATTSMDGAEEAEPKFEEFPTPSHSQSEVVGSAGVQTPMNALPPPPSVTPPSSGLSRYYRSGGSSASGRDGGNDGSDGDVRFVDPLTLMDPTECLVEGDLDGLKRPEVDRLTMADGPMTAIYDRWRDPFRTSLTPPRCRDGHQVKSGDGLAARTAFGRLASQHTPSLDRSFDDEEPSEKTTKGLERESQSQSAAARLDSGRAHAFDVDCYRVTSDATWFGNERAEVPRTFASGVNDGVVPDVAIGRGEVTPMRFRPPPYRTRPVGTDGAAPPLPPYVPNIAGAVDDANAARRISVVTSDAPLRLAPLNNRARWLE